MITIETTRICKVCGIEKPIDDFKLSHKKWRCHTCRKCDYTLHREVCIEYVIRYYVRHKEVILAKLFNKRFGTKYGEILRKRSKENQKRLSAENLSIYGYVRSPEAKEKQRLQCVGLRKQVLEYYGGKCECCGEARYEMLTIDHIQGNGHKTDKRGLKLVYDAIKVYNENGYPNSTYRLLCWNCNMSSGLYGYCPHKIQTEWNINRGRKLKSDMIKAYGGKCVLCGETHSEFLTIDHINGGGTEHKRSLGITDIYPWLRRQGWPKNGYRLLCANCNCSDKQNGWASRKARKEESHG